MEKSETCIVIIEDDVQLRSFLRTGLAVHHYRIVETANAREGLAAVEAENPDTVLLDLGLPDRDGAELVLEIRARSAVPIVIVSARHDTEEKIKALDNGADDYVTKPFDMAELLARIRSALRRRATPALPGMVLRSGTLEVDLYKNEVRVSDRPVKLSPREMTLLRLLAIHADKVLTHQAILKEVWGVAHLQDTHYLRIFIGRLRQKLETDPSRPQHIITESGVGYRLRRNPPAD